MTCSIVCALDPVGAWGARQLADQQSIPIHLMSGPVTDDSAGLDFLRDRLNTPGINAIAQQEELGSFVARLVTGST
jgi:hypothetical protein